MAKTETTKLNIYQKLHSIQKNINGLGKDKSAFGYKYVTGDKVLEHIKPMMNELGLLLKQEVVSIENTRQDYTTKSGAKSEINSKVMQRFTWVDIDTGDKDVNEFGANGQNDWDKGVGSALTYGERYFLLKYFHIATDEDDIDNPERKPQEESAPVQKAKEAPKTPMAAQPETNGKTEEFVPDPNVKYATAKQKEEIIRLINHVTITRQEKTKTLLSINKLEEEKAAEYIVKLRKVIEEREEQNKAA